MGTMHLFISLLVGSFSMASALVTPVFDAQSRLVVDDTKSPRLGARWDMPPREDDCSNHIFFRLATLLQLWPNTRYPSGSSIVPGTIPLGTTLYRGWSDAEVPSGRDWLAFDPEHSALFSRSSNSRLITFVTTRSIRILYFDGSSAAKLSSGALDTQNLLAWGRIGSNPMMEEQTLFADLCEWAKPHNIDGFVRMEMSFEVMYCDFDHGLKVVSSVHILPTEDTIPNKHPHGPPDLTHSLVLPPPTTSRGPGMPPPGPPGDPRRHPGFPAEPRPPNWKGALLETAQRGFEVFQAGAWHHRSPGEVRIHLDAARLVSIYDPALRSGAAARKGLEKVLHRGKGLSDGDIAVWRNWITDMVRSDPQSTSGVDWRALTTVIMDRYGVRLEYLSTLLQPDHALRNATAAVQDVRTQLLIMLTPYLTSDTIPLNATRTSSSPAAQYSQIRRQEHIDYEWVRPVADHCSTSLVSHLPRDKFTREEHTLYSGISGTLRELCRVLSMLWSQAYDPSPAVEPADLLEGWRKELETLMRWLDWPMWNRCIPECSLDTLCFIPTWPIGIGAPPGSGQVEDLTKVNWSPKCVPRGQLPFEHNE